MFAINFMEEHGKGFNPNQHPTGFRPDLLPYNPF